MAVMRVALEAFSRLYAHTVTSLGVFLTFKYWVGYLHGGRFVHISG